MHSSNALLFILLSFIGGIFIVSFFDVPQLIIYELLVLGVIYSLVFFKHKTILVFGLCLIALCFGLYRAQTMTIPEPSYSAGASTTQPLSMLRQRFNNVINRNLSPPESSILSAILLGNKQEISKEWKEKLNRAGIRHITAVSGMHIVILSGILLWLGVGVGLYRGQAFYFAVGFLWLFILMIGAPPSAVRAGIMGSMVLLAQKLGRQSSSDRVLLLTASVMLIQDPTLLRYSIGFQLSFSAVLGIIYLMSFFQHYLGKLKPLKFLKIDGLLAMSFAAQIFVLPLLIYYFGQFSIISPITNLLIVPLLPILMVVGFLFVILGAIYLPLALIFLMPVWILLSYITKLTNFFANLSFSTVSFQLHWLWLPVVYILLGIIVWKIKTRQKISFLP
ncbi:MAG: ComEC/Rec2 family competence protein [Parcubacteria group bacterium]|nr:ComEC/Rec2 family competence protein [Parcubacteria group bacterium]